MTASRAAGQGEGFTVDAKALSAALADVTRAAGRRSIVQVLGGVHMVASVEAQTVTCRCTNMDVAITATVAAEVRSGGALLVAEARQFAATVKVMTGPLDFDADDKTVTVRNGIGSVSFPRWTEEDYPLPPAMPEEWETVDRAAFLDVVSFVLPCVSDDPSRPILCGVQLKIAKDEGVEASATDGYRLAHDERPVEASGSLLAVVQGDALKEVARLAKRRGAGETIAWRVSDAGMHVSFAVGAVEVTSRLIEGTFPNWRQLIPDRFEREVRLSGGELVYATKRLAQVAQRGAPVRFAAANDGTVRLSVDGSYDSPSAQVTLPTAATVSGDDIGEIGFDAKFLLDAAGVGDDLTVSMLSPRRLALFRNGRPEAFHLLMPVRLA